MTNKKLTDETIAALLERARSGCDFYLSELDDVERALVELQQSRKAGSAEPACYALTNMGGEVYNTHSSAQNAEAYRNLIHQSDDSLTLSVTPLYAAPTPMTDAERSELQERRKADGVEPVAWLNTENNIGIPAITISRKVADSWQSKGWNIQPLYTAQKPFKAL